MNGKCFYVLYYGHVILNEWEMLSCALCGHVILNDGNCFYVLYYGHVILNEWEMLLCALLWACNTEWMGTAFLCFIMDM